MLRLSSPTRAFLQLALAVSLVSRAAGQSTLDMHRTFLASVRSPEELVLPRFPRQYAVPVTLSGSIAEEMRHTLADLDIEQPRYRETLDRKGRFELEVANDNYSAETRDLIAGILNPVEMIDAVLGSIVRYRRHKQLTEMLKETELVRSTTTRGGVRMHVVRLRPAGKRFSYTYEDLGAYVQESWLTNIELLIDSSTMIARELDLVKHTRLFRADDTRKPEAQRRHQRYVFTYSQFEGAPVPSKLSVYLDSVQTLVLSATYRTHEGRVVFDTRHICYFPADGARQCLDMTYGTYNIDATSLVLKLPDDGEITPRQVKAAAGLARKAAESLRQGRIESAVRTLRAIAQNYPGTPQAVEAQKLLQGLPEVR